MFPVTSKSNSLSCLIPVAAVLAVLLAVPTPTLAINWCHDYVYSVISQGQDLNQLSAEGLRYELWRRGYAPVNGPVVLREPVVGSPQVGSTLFTFTGQPSDSQYLREGDVLIFGEDHSGIVVTADGLINHFLQDSKVQGHKYTIYEAMHAMDSVMPDTSLLRRRWTLDAVRYESHPSAGGGPPVQPYKNLPLQVWRPGFAHLMVDWADGPISYDTNTPSTQIGRRRDSRFGSPVPNSFGVYGPGLDEEYALEYIQFNFSGGRAVYLFMAINRTNTNLRYVTFKDPDNGEWSGWHPAYDLHLYW
jgi:hypothetical protein